MDDIENFHVVERKGVVRNHRFGSFSLQDHLWSVQGFLLLTMVRGAMGDVRVEPVALLVLMVNLGVYNSIANVKPRVYRRQ